MCYAFIQLIYVLYFQFFIYYTDQLWQDGHLVLDEVGVDRGSIVYPLAPVPHPPPPMRLHPPLPRVIAPPSLLVHKPRSLLKYLTLSNVTQSLSLHSPNRLLYLHLHLKEVRLAVSLLLRLLLTPVSPVHKVLKSPRPPPHKAP